SSLAKMKAAVPGVFGLAVVPTRNLPVIPAKTVPVGPPSTSTTSDWIAPALLYSVDRSVPLSATHHGLVPPRVRPQALTRCGSVTAAAPGTSETSGVTMYEPSGGVAGKAVATASASVETVASRAIRRTGLRMRHPPSVSSG